jgi:hypothetical protein
MNIKIRKYTESQKIAVGVSYASFQTCYGRREQADYLCRKAPQDVRNAGRLTEMFSTYPWHEALAALKMRQELSRSAEADPISRRRK